MTCAAIVGLVMGDTAALAQGPGPAPAPTTSSGFRMYNSATEWITIRSGANGGTGTFLWPLPSEGIFTSDASGTMSIQSINDLINGANLQLNHLWVGNAANNPSQLAPGTPDQILQIDASGAPVWQSVNLLPTGSTNNATLVWDQTSGVWVENNNVTMDPTTGDINATGSMSVGGNSTLGDASTDAVTINAGTVNAPNLNTTSTVGGGILVTDASGNIEEISPDDLMGGTTLPENNFWIGDASNNPTTFGPGTSDQILQINASGAPEWQDVNLLPTGTTNYATLVWDQTNGVWIENDKVTLNPNTGMMVMGSASTDALVINAGDVTAPNLGTATTVGGGVLVTDASGNIEEISPDDLMGNTTLTQDHIWVGDASNNPGSVAPGNDQEVLMINGTTPTWTEINLIPDGTLNNSTLVWSTAANDWIENTKVTMSPVTGNIETSGDIVADDLTLTGNTVLGDGASDDLTINGDQIVAPNLLTSTSPDVDDDAILVIDPTTNVISRADPDDLLGTMTLNENAIWVGDATNKPSELGAGSQDQVLQINASGAPEWQDVNLLPTGTTNNATLVWDQVNGVWVENNNVTMNPTNGDISAAGNGAFGGDMSVAGNSSVDGNATLGDGSSDAVMINAGTVTAPNLGTATTVGGGVLVTDASGNIEEISPDDLMGGTTLPENNFWIGDASNNPTTFGPGTSDQILQINGSGAPEWQDVNLLPTGSTNNATLVWDQTNGVWVENSNVTMDPTNGDVSAAGNGAFGGDMSVAGSSSVDGNTTLGDGSGDAVTINAGTVTAPNLGTATTVGGGVLVTDASGNVEEISPDDLMGNTTLNENAIWVGDASNNPSELSSSGTEGDVLTVNASGTPTWSSPVGTVKALGNVTGTGVWSYTVTPGVTLSPSSVIVVTLESGTGMQMTYVVTNRTATTFDVEFPVNISADERFHWVVY